VKAEVWWQLRLGRLRPTDRRIDAGTTPADRDCADDSSGSGPDQTAAYRAHRADRVVAEVNNGGEIGA
jgi:hypothetical protein